MHAISYMIPLILCIQQLKASVVFLWGSMSPLWIPRLSFNNPAMSLKIPLVSYRIPHVSLRIPLSSQRIQLIYLRIPSVSYSISPSGLRCDCLDILYDSIRFLEDFWMPSMILDISLKIPLSSQRVPQHCLRTPLVSFRVSQSFRNSFGCPYNSIGFPKGIR